MRVIIRVVLAMLAAVLGSAGAWAERPVVHVYNWSDYIAEDTIQRFEHETGIKVVYDVYDSNEVLESKLLAGKSGYDLVFPTARPFAQRHIAAGLYHKLDMSKLTNYGNLDEHVLEALQGLDPGNQYVVPYMIGSTGLGYNIAKVKGALGNDAPVDSWKLILDLANTKKLAGCGISLLDDDVEVISAALIYLGKSPNSTDPLDIQAAAELLSKVRPYIKYFHSSQYINDLANGDICVAQGYSGDVLQARDRAEKAMNGVEIGYSIPREGALMSTDVMAIPADAPHVDSALALINYLLRPEVIAAITSYVSYANPNKAATPLVDESVRDDPGIYPPPAVRARLVTAEALPLAVQRLRVRRWTRIKTGH